MFIKAIIRIDQIHDQTHKSFQSSKWCEEDEEKGGRFLFSLSKMIIMIGIGQWWWVSWSFEDQTGGGRRLIWGAVSKIIASKWCCGDPHQDHEYHSHHLIWKQGLLPKGIQHWFADQHMIMISIWVRNWQGDESERGQMVSVCKVTNWGLDQMGQGWNRVLVSLIFWPGQLLSLNPCRWPKFLARMLFGGFCLKQ